MESSLNLRLEFANALRVYNVVVHPADFDYTISITSRQSDPVEVELRIVLQKDG